MGVSSCVLAMTLCSTLFALPALTPFVKKPLQRRRLNALRPYSLAFRYKPDLFHRRDPNLIPHCDRRRKGTKPDKREAAEAFVHDEGEFAPP